MPDGTYWLRALVDPNNFLAESDKSNNETDVLVTISGNKVTVHQPVVPILAPPPGITLTAPADQTIVSGPVNLAASPEAHLNAPSSLDQDRLVRRPSTRPVEPHPA